MDLHLIGASALARRIKDGEVTAEAALEHFIDRIERLDGALNAVVVRRFEQARERAREADRALARGEDWGALHGVPMTVKETYEIAGWPPPPASRRCASMSRSAPAWRCSGCWTPAR